MERPDRSMDGVTVLSATLASQPGTFAVQVSRGTAIIDDVHIVAE